ncbi:MAG: hypothetical protein M5U01_24770 [Ardenticatenaceae bacterium]|nr:hypothetical protein [Ardenticatenaceae bacterium]
MAEDSERATQNSEPTLVRPPAVVVGGPPHSGKSVFSYHLDRMLRGRKLDFYHLGANPDGEGHWSQEVSALERATLRRKGTFTPEFVARMAATVASRELLLLLDVGGRISPENERIMRPATHAIVLAGNPRLAEAWVEFCGQCGLELLARFDSQLNGVDQLATPLPGRPLRGTLGGLARGAPVAGPVLAATAERVAALFAGSPQPLSAAPGRLVDLYELAETVGVGWRDSRLWWEPQDLPATVAALPPGRPAALFGPAPMWGFAALLLAAAPEARWCYNARSGWHAIAPLPTADPPAGVLAWKARNFPGAVWLAYERPQVVTRADLAAMAIPPVPAGRGVILDGRGPNWLLAALAASYPAAPWVAIREPRCHGAVIVRGNAERPLGSLFPR